MSRNKIIAVFILVMMMFSLAGCGSPTAADKSFAGTQQTETAKTVTDKSVTITVAHPDKTVEVDGYYTGEVKGNKPEGKGQFAYWDNNDTYSMEYEGGFSYGTFNGKGKQTEKDGNRGIIRVYEGEFKDGNYNGYGTLTITDTNNNTTIQVAGSFTKGIYTPTVGQAFDYIGQTGYFGEFTLSDELMDYIDGHDELFPTCEKAAAEAADLVSFKYKQFTKTRKQEEIGLIKLKLTAMQVFEDDFLNDEKLTSVLAHDSENNYYAVYYRDSVEVYDGDSFTVYGIPCATTSFSNRGGGTTSVIVLLACRLD